jgi:hypothetical protein
MTKSICLATVLSLTACASAGLAPPAAATSAADAPEAAVADYHTGFIARDAARVRAAIGDTLVLVNGNFSDDPRGWQAHQYLSGAELDAWPATTIADAGPFKNDWQVVHVSRRGDAAVVVTVETGRNRQRAWNREVATWLLGKTDAGWRIVGLYVRDVGTREVVKG